MKRDPELIRKLVLYFEEKTDGKAVTNILLSGEDAMNIKYHILLMAQAGLIDYEPIRSKKGRLIDVVPFNLTWAGHDFVAAARDDVLWKRGLKRTTQAAGGVVFDVLVSVLVDQAKKAVGLSS